MTRHGRLTLPAEVGAERETLDLIKRLGADATRNSDGTDLPEGVAEMVEKVYRTWFVARGDNDHARTHLDELQQVYLLSERVTATADGALVIDPMVGFLAEQVRPAVEHDPKVWWEVRDRTAGTVLDPGDWDVADDGVVTIAAPSPWHEYTVAFLAQQIWDPTQMYNYITNDWNDREKSMPYDARYPATWEFMKRSLGEWLAGHPEIDVVRFTTFFYHFTLVFNEQRKEKFVDWFGYSESVSVAALKAFEEEFGYRLTPEDFVTAGSHNSYFEVPSTQFRNWLEFQQRFVTDRARQLVEIVHDAGREAMMFLGDNWVGTEPYGEHWPKVGMDAVVGSVGSAVTARMIADIPHVKYTEGRLLPYFFPDVFREGGDPVGEAKECWIAGRRAMLRNPLDRIGYGGYLSLALKFPEFIDYTEQVVTEFRDIHDNSEGTSSWRLPTKVAVLNSWGRLRTWQTHMVAHALWYKQIYTYGGVTEALAGMPVDVEFISFDDVRAGKLADVDIVINAGAAGTSFSGATEWADPQVVTALRAWVHGGGAFIGVGDPSGHVAGGRAFQLADVLGVDRELGFTLSTDKYYREAEAHFITADAPERLDIGEGARDVYQVGATSQVLRMADGDIHVAVNEYGAGRAVYLAGLPYSADNTRLLHRAILWATRLDGEELSWWSSNPHTEVGAYPTVGRFVVVNNSAEAQRTTVTIPGAADVELEVPAFGARWQTVPD